jgi:hypothetical protein
MTMAENLAQLARAGFNPQNPYREMSLKSGFAEELTPAGPQLVIPGCERVTDKREPRQMTLFA